MKKIHYALQMIVISTIFSASMAYAGNASFIFSIRDSVHTELPVLDKEDLEPLLVGSVAPKDSEGAIGQTLEINGEVERLDVNGTSTLQLEHEVISEDDLEKYIKSLVRNDADLSKVKVTSDGVSVTRQTPAKLLGVFSLSGTETAEVISWGNGTSAVTIDRPWWSMFYDYETDKSLISKDIYQRIQNISPTELTSNLNANTKARIIAEIKSAFNSSASQ